MSFFLVLLFAGSLSASKAPSKYAVTGPQLNAKLLKLFPNIIDQPNEQVAVANEETEITALQYAIKYLGLADVRAVLALDNIDPNFPSDYLPLRLAIEMAGASPRGDVEVIRALLQAGANPNGADDEGKTQLIHAAEQDFNTAEMIKILLDSKASLTDALRRTKPNSSIRSKLSGYLPNAASTASTASASASASAQKKGK